MNKLYGVVVKSFEVMIIIFLALLVFAALASNNLLGVLVLLIGFVVTFSVWSVFMLILKNLEEINRSLKQ